MVGADPGPAPRLSILREPSGLSRSPSGKGSEKGFSDAVRIWGGGMIGMREPVRLYGGREEDWKLSRARLCRRWRTNTTKPATRAATNTTTRMLTPAISFLDTPLVAPLDDAAEPVVEDDATGSTGIVVVAESVVDVADSEEPMPVALLDVAPALVKIVLASLELLEVSPTLPGVDVELNGTGTDVEPALAVGGSDVGGTCTDKPVGSTTPSLVSTSTFRLLKLI